MSSSTGVLAVVIINIYDVVVVVGGDTTVSGVYHFNFNSVGNENCLKCIRSVQFFTVKNKLFFKTNY